MPLAYTCPPAAQLYLRTVLSTPSPHGLGALLKAFLDDTNITEPKIRTVAAAKGVTITAVIRALMIKRYPALKPLWPAVVHTPAQIAAIRGRTRSPDMDNAVLRAACMHIQSLLNDRDNNQTRRHALAFIRKHQPQLLED